METLEIVLIVVLIFFNIILTYRSSKRDFINESNELKSNIEFLKHDILRIEGMVKDEISKNREEIGKVMKENREEIGSSFDTLGKSTNQSLTDIGKIQKGQLIIFSDELKKLIKISEEKYKSMQDRIQTDGKENRKELNEGLQSFQESFKSNINEFNDIQEKKFGLLMEQQKHFNLNMEHGFERIRESVEKNLEKIQVNNEKKLEEMRITVDEKLQESVEKRFDNSFKIISERLEQVHKGLGEMQILANGVGDLKKVLTNVKTRGMMGEIQLGCILEQMMSREQYEENVSTKKGSLERVEFAIKLPGKDVDDNPVLLPIDSKFPIEDYQRLLEIYDNAQDYSSVDVERYVKNFESVVKKSAKDIKEKYINPPYTTDFAIMFVPTENLYAEILRRSGLFELLQREFKITVVGPTNLVAFLSSLQMGFRTLAVEKKSSEVWNVLGAVKTEFGKFGEVIDKTRKKLQEATNVIDKAGVRTRAIERKLREVEELPQNETMQILGESLEVKEEVGV